MPFDGGYLIVLLALVGIVIELTHGMSHEHTHTRKTIKPITVLMPERRKA